VNLKEEPNEHEVAGLIFCNFRPGPLDRSSCFVAHVKRFAGKWSNQKMSNGVLLSMPAIVTFAALLIGQSFLTVTVLPPRGIQNAERINSIERAEKRIDDLEVHTEYLENYLVYERQRQMVLVTGLSAIFCLSLFVVGLGTYKPMEDEE
jgi:hypothetical protein